MIEIPFFKLDPTLKITKKDIETDKKFFKYYKESLYGNNLIYYDFEIAKELECYEESNMNKYIKEKFKKEKDKSYLYDSLDRMFLNRFGISYLLFNENQKEEFINSDLTYESIKKLSYEVSKNNIKNCKKELPKEIYECFDDYCFIMVCQTEDNHKIDKNNFLLRIRDYFILDKYKNNCGSIRNEKKFEEIRKNMIDIYGQLKEKYGRNRYYEKFLSFFSNDTDYNYPETKSILNNYYKYKNYDSYLLIKQKED